MKLIKILLILFLFSCCKNNTPASKQIDKRLYLKAVYKGTYRLSQNDSKLYFLVDVTLINNTDSACKFLISSCTTGASVLVDSEQVSICTNQCSENHPESIIVNPNQEFTIAVILQADIKGLNLSCPLKLGLVLVPASRVNQEDFYIIRNKMVANKENVLWSDLIYLSIAGGAPYEIR